MHQSLSSKKPYHGPCPLDSLAGLGEYCCWVLVLVLVPLWLAGGTGAAIELGIVTRVSLGLSFVIGSVILAMTDGFLTLPNGRAAVLTLIVWQGWPLVVAYALSALIFFCMPVCIACLAKRLWNHLRWKQRRSRQEHVHLERETASGHQWRCRFHAIVATMVAFVSAVVGFAWLANRSGGPNEYWPTILLFMFVTLLIPLAGPLLPMVLRRKLVATLRRSRSPNRRVAS